ncbi:peptidoglycan-binding domain-containing protein [Streptomyces sp. URMC 129]|uniref:peptidoglycan-binding domain-containing protein n=1 Tax=Streptomyces sp. URMC 129 TaxID=3423407 RepID=UPI003F19B75A
MNVTRARLAACAIGVLTAATLAVSTAPASASGTYSGHAYVYGADSFVGDWGNEGILSTSTHAYSNATCLWQKILWADGFLSSSGIDGVFGANTREATEDWQALEGLTADGVVGQGTFGRADNYLTYVSGSESPGSSLVLRYDGYAYDITITRDSQGRYGFYDAGGTHRAAGYDYRTCG